MIGQQCRPLGRARWFAVAALVALLSAGQAGRAAVRYVNQAAAGPAHDGTSWANAFTTVGAGLGAAVSGDEVWVAKGTYLETTSVRAGVSLYGGFAGTETSRTQRDWKVNPTILDGAGGTGDVLTCLDNTVVDGFTIRNGGLGVYVNGKATLSNNAISGNRNGVLVNASAAALTNNTISGNGQSGVYVSSGMETLTNNTISGNGGSGVEVYFATVTLSNNIVAFNGGYGFYSYDGTIPAFSHNNVYGNTKGQYYSYTPPDGQGNLSLDPLLSNRYRNIHIQPDSPCIDAGDDAEVPSGSLDIDNQTRIQGSHVDIGSDESDGTEWNVPAITWYVSSAGNDASNGRSWPTAKRTVAAALSLVEGADEVWVAKGTYTETTIVPAGVGLYGGFAGTETSRGERKWFTNPTVLDGGGSTGNVVVTSLESTLVDGFTIQNGGSGVHVYSGNLATLKNNTIAGNSNNGLDVVQGTAMLSNNMVSGNLNGVSVANQSTATLSNNTISGNGNGGVYAWYGTVTLSNNTIAGNGTRGVGVDTGSTATLSNNIVAFNGGYGLQKFGGGIPTFSHNDVYGNTKGQYSGYTPPDGQGNLSVDPLFVDQTNRDYHLQSGSPCIDAGDDSVVVAGDTDLDGKPRIQGAHVDIGAYEYGTGPAPFTVADVTKCLSIACGLISGSPDEVSRLDVEPPPVTGFQLDIRDALRIARKVAGLEANP